MASEQELQQQIAAAKREVEEAEHRTEQLEGEIQQATRRQKLRRELEAIKEDRNSKIRQNLFIAQIRKDIDADCDCEDEAPAQTDEVFPLGGQVNVTTAITKGEYIWKVRGMRWLKSALAQSKRLVVRSDDFVIGESRFELVYAPTPCKLPTTQFSLAIRHRQAKGIIFCYKMFIQRADGDFIQWGGEGNECHPNWNDMQKAFGPDVQKPPENGAELEHPVGIFGLKHEDLVQSVWVDSDTLTVKVQIEEMGASSLCVETEGLTPDVSVPPPTMATNLLSMLEDGRCCDTTFVVEGQQVRAHSVILCARSEVFDRELNGCMQESISKIVEIKDIDFATFDVFLRFLYTDDLDRVQSMIKNKVAADREVPVCSKCESTSAANPRAAILQSVLAASHRYQVQRLSLWCEGQLCQYICKDHVCSILCQAHLYEAKQLEKACLFFVKSNMDAVMATRGFGSLSAEWPEVVLKINMYLADLSESKASEAISAHDESRKKRAAQHGIETLETESTKRARSE